jgi:fluoroquinolone resistance protein
MPEADYDAIYRELQQHNRISDADLSWLNFDEGTFESAHFDNCGAAGARFVGGDLLSSTWIKCRFAKCQLSNLNLAGARFENCRFFDSESTSGCLFRFCDLRGAAFENCDLTLSTFFVCDLCDVRFADCLMSGITFEKPSFAFTSRSSARTKRPVRLAGIFERCNMTNAITKSADFSSLKIIDCDLANAELEGTLFVNSSLRGTNLTNASLRMVDLSGADLRGADLSGLELHELKSFSGMQVSASQQHHLLRSIGVDVFADED